MRVKFFACSQNSEKAPVKPFYECLNWPNDEPLEGDTIAFEATRNRDPVSGEHDHDVERISGVVTRGKTVGRRIDVFVDLGLFAKELQNGLVVERWLGFSRRKK